ncbi:DUF1446 domain-containing protein [Intrasporangium calvum]|uniref:DUF1446 domain-containing protein n=1 Tax=Intrasporangium calvum TaxID=53358 RepID=A0ABT5GFC9_9MICO|nr:acyclic terpene utilization AtuA family protein [Intrasporangium calvum]MDC5696535.1 DUF1446 domain-containing protein [Intrasporangium calvum]
MSRTVRIGSGSAYWGDVLEPAIDLARDGKLDYIAFDHLAELTLAILQRQRAKDPDSGYIADIIPWTEAILPIARQNGVRMLTDAGGANPLAGAKKVVEIAKRNGFDGMKVGVVTGDDVLEQVLRLHAEGHIFENLDNGDTDFAIIKDKIVAANAYIGAEGMVEALDAGAEVVVAGRVSDNAMYVAPLMHEFKWGFDKPELIGAAVTIGHLLECAALMTGSLSNFWSEAGETWNIGFPFADVSEDGTAVFSKLEGTGGLVTEMTLKEQLVYEISDPARYLMPDGIADFTKPHFEQVGPDKVRATGMTGIERPETLKVCIGYMDGWIGEAIAMFSWPDAREKAEKGAEIVRRRLDSLGVKPLDIAFEYLGMNTLHGPVAPALQCEPNEVGLRIAARCATREEADIVRREALHLWTLGGVGSAILPPGRPRPVIGLWPTLIPRSEVQVDVEILTV